jgi:mono/diheme cytochrome c family protein
MRTQTIILGALGAVALGSAVWWSGQGDGAGPSAQITIPPLSAAAEAGKAAFDANCAACHGANGAGSERGPTFAHPVYKPSHHGDMSFVLAATQGARAHHWGFGDMPPVAGITRQEVESIILYVRAIQRANGID